MCGRMVKNMQAERESYPFAEDRLPESLHFAESDVIVGVVRGEKCPQSRLWA
jgi:hypothetical protein